MRKPGTKVKERPKVKVEVKNYLNQQQLDEFAVLLKNLFIPESDKQTVAREFCRHFHVKEEERFLSKLVN